MKDFSRLEKLINDFVDKGSVPGCSVAVMQNDELIYHGEAGYSVDDVALAMKAAISEVANG